MEHKLTEREEDLYVMYTQFNVKEILTKAELIDRLKSSIKTLETAEGEFSKFKLSPICGAFRPLQVIVDNTLHIFQDSDEDFFNRIKPLEK